MPVEDAIGAALLVLLSAALTLLALTAFRRQRGRSFLLLATAFALFLAEALLISLAVLDLGFGTGVSLAAITGLQVVALLLMYVASFSPR